MFLFSTKFLEYTLKLGTNWPDAVILSTMFTPMQDKGLYLNLGLKYER